MAKLTLTDYLLARFTKDELDQRFGSNVAEAMIAKVPKNRYKAKRPKKTKKSDKSNK